MESNKIIWICIDFLRIIPINDQVLQLFGEEEIITNFASKKFNHLLLKNTCVITAKNVKSEKIKV